LAEVGKKKVGEGTPPLEKRSMVSEKDLENFEKLRKGEDAEIPSTDTLILFAIEQMYDMKVQLKRIADSFEGVKKNKPEEIVPLTAPENAETPIPSVVPTGRVAEVVAAFEPIKDLVLIDTNASAQFVVVKMNGYLGGDKFAKVGKIARQLGGEYVSKGKESHFKIPKMTTQSKLSDEAKKAETGKQTVPATLNDPIGNVKQMFSAELIALLDFTVEGNAIVMRPKKFLGSENFAKIASVVRGMNGEYVSMGKDSHFKIVQK